MTSFPSCTECTEDGTSLNFTSKGLNLKQDPKKLTPEVEGSTLESLESLGRLVRINPQTFRHTEPRPNQATICRGEKRAPGFPL